MKICLAFLSVSVVADADDAHNDDDDDGDDDDDDAPFPPSPFSLYLLPILYHAYCKGGRAYVCCITSKDFNGQVLFILGLNIGF